MAEINQIYGYDLRDTSALQKAVFEATEIPETIEDVVYRVRGMRRSKTLIIYKNNTSANTAELKGDFTILPDSFEGDPCFVAYPNETTVISTDGEIIRSIWYGDTFDTFIDMGDSPYTLSETSEDVTVRIDKYVYYLGDATHQTVVELAIRQVIENYVDGAVSSVAVIADVNNLPTGSNIKDIIYRLATTANNVTTYSYYMGDSVNQTTEKIPTVDDIANYIPNAGNTTNDNLVIQRNTFKLSGGNNLHVESWGGGVILGDNWLYDGLFVNESITKIKTRAFDVQGGEDIYFHNGRDIILRPGRNVNIGGTNGGGVYISPIGPVEISPTGNVTINPSGTVSIKGYIPNTGGTLTGDVTTPVTEFTSTSLVTRQFVEDAIAAMGLTIVNGQLCQTYTG